MRMTDEVGRRCPARRARDAALLSLRMLTVVR
jgi:hypothetical protein